MVEKSQLPTYEYLDFDIQIGKGDGYQYPVSVHSKGGDANESIAFPFETNELKRYLDKLEIALLRSGKRHRQISEEEKQVREFGKKLFQAFFTQDIRSCYDRSLTLAQAQRKEGLRIRLNIQADELSAFPWEFLYDPGKGDFLCLSSHTPVVRYLDCGQVIPPMEVELPLQVMGMVSSPSNLEELNIEQEKTNLEKALAPLIQRGLAKLTWLEDGSWRALLDALNRGPWHIFHFIGHGGYDKQEEEGMVAFEGVNKRAQYFSAGELARLLGEHSFLRLVLLNACESAQSGGGDVFSSTAATLLRRGLPAVIAMQNAISDLAAIELSQMFYKSLAAGLPVDAALSRARLALSFAIQNTLEWGTPVLFMRSEDGVLFRLKPPEEAAIPRELEREAGEVPAPVQKTDGTQASPPVSKPVTVSERGKELLITLAPNVTMSLVHVAAGGFLMGSDKRKDNEAWDDETPQHKLYLPDYFVGKTPVTVAQFECFIKAKNYQTAAANEGSGWVWDAKKSEWAEVKGVDWRHPHGPNSSVERKARHPITQVSWLDAQEFCSWLCEVSQLDVRLPSEAEWEKAARGTEGFIYPWGNDLPDGSRCNYDLNVGDTTHVGSYSPLGDSPYGCVDMAGNVWEWTRSLWGENVNEPDFKYPYKAGDGRENEDATGLRVLRGGSFDGDLRRVRCACRYWYFPDLRDSDNGFRVLVSPIHL